MATHREPVLEAFGAAVRELRVRRGLSQEGLADLVGIHRTYIGDVERGRRNIGLRNIARIAQALDLSVAALFEVVEGRTGRT